MKTLYHATEKKNVFSIMREGLKPGPDGHVYLADTQDGAARFLYPGIMVGVYGHDIAVIPVNVDGLHLVESHDHNEKYFQSRAWCYTGTIAADRIPQNLEDIPLFWIGKGEKPEEEEA